MLRKKKLKLEDIKISSFIIAQEGLNVKGRAGNTGNPYMLCFPDCMITLDCGTETC